MDYRLEELIDVTKFQSLLDSLNDAFNFATAIIDNDSNVLTASGWQEICTAFHRPHPEIEPLCRQSDRSILSHLNEGSGSVSYRCPMGLIDAATPIIIGGRHLGNVFIGQLLLEKPDPEPFRGQAKTYGFDEEAYLKALAKVPVLSMEQLERNLAFIRKFSELLGEIGLSRLKQIEVTEELNVHQERLEELVAERTAELRASCKKLKAEMAERQRSEEERRRLEEQLLQSQKMEAVGQLAGGIAHDFNNILTGIIGFGSLLEMSLAEDDPQRLNVKHILSSARRAADLTRSLLAFSRKQIINPKHFDLNAVIYSTVIFLKRVVGGHIELKTAFQQDELVVNADIGQIEQVLTNLVVNAQDAMPDGGTVSIETDAARIDAGFIAAHGFGAEGMYARMVVSDTGVGMDDDVRNRLFEPFFTTKDVGKGTGLGLSIVYGIVKQHNGFVTVKSEPGKGAAFSIYLPLAEQQAALADEVCETPEQGTETVLVADDDEVMRALAEQALPTFGYNVITAVDGVDAVEKFRENRESIRLVILDVIMPKKNGKEAFEEIRAIRPGVKALFISGYTSDIANRKGRIGEAELLAKPLDPRDLLKKVREALGKGEAD